ncbi:homoserine dehydrogenase [Candidatus Electronema sp. JM]|uniref:homoserine dehydrogenase n=1 Tax=Candidatus Electronema sp. JM TaxID=3401571 RepID=UPI003AA8BE88
MNNVNVGLIGFGTVGKGLAEALRRQQERIAQRSGLRIQLTKIYARSLAALPPAYAAAELTKDADAVLNDPDIQIAVELIGGIEPAKTFILKAIAAGKHVVTANKALLSQHGREIFAAAAAKGVEIGFEGSVGGGIPLIKTLKEGLAANELLSVTGILNGTANYILTRMTDERLPFAEVLREAQRLGFAEADPTYDVEGIDTAHKLAILMSIAYGMNISPEQIATEGISRIEPVDIEFAREFGCRIKLLAVSRSVGGAVEARVHPTMVPESHLLASISGANNAAEFCGDLCGSIILSGAGAGSLPTGSAVAADVIDIARNIAAGAVGRAPALAWLPEHIIDRPIAPLSALTCPCYLRITALDQPGVLASIASILSQHSISIESVLQKGRKENEPVAVVILTHTAKEEAVAAALREIDALDTVAAPTVRIRMLEE